MSADADGPTPRVTILDRLVGIYVVIITQLFGWLLVIGALTAIAGLAANLFGGQNTLEGSVQAGWWVAILLGGPVAVGACVLAARRYLRREAWPDYPKTGRKVVTVIWLGMATMTALSTDTLLSGLPWYGLVAVGIWLIAPRLLQLAPKGT